MDQETRLLFEGEVEERWRSIGVDPLSPEGAGAFAVGVIPDLVIERIDRSLLRGDDARIIRRRQQNLVQLANDLTPKGENFALAHECGEWLVHVRQYRRPDKEQLCNFIAGAIIAPRPAMLRAAGWYGLSPGRLSEAFVLGVVAVTLRYAEVTGRALAIVTKNAVHVRGEAWEWGSTAELRRIATGAVRAAPFQRINLGSQRILLVPRE